MGNLQTPQEANEVIEPAPQKYSELPGEHLSLGGWIMTVLGLGVAVLATLMLFGSETGSGKSVAIIALGATVAGVGALLVVAGTLRKLVYSTSNGRY